MNSTRFYIFRARDWSHAAGVPRKRYGAIAEVRKARRREFSCFCEAKCEPFGEQKKTREVSERTTNAQFIHIRPTHISRHIS